VHANQIGIMNTAAGFLSRKAGIALANALFITTNALVGVAGLSAQFAPELATIRSRMETIMQRPDLLPPWPNDPTTS
jgi:NAD/NADP transhydrogenase beta subunit